MAQLFLILLRVIHILGGVFWAGGAFILAGYIGPTAADVGPSAGAFMSTLLKKRRLSSAIGMAAMASTLAGLLLYWQVSGGFNAAWIGSGTGIGLTVGSLAGLASALVGGAVVGRTSEQMMHLGDEMAAQDGPPDAAKIEQLAVLQARLATGSTWNVIFLVIAILGMSTAQYLRF